MCPSTKPGAAMPRPDPGMPTSAIRPSSIRTSPRTSSRSTNAYSTPRRTRASVKRRPVDPHRRYNPLSGEWVLVSPQRTQRPWQGHVERATLEELPEYDSACYLCPGNERAGGERNPDYDETFVFTNDYPALVRSGKGEYGTCRVVCYS